MPPIARRHRPSRLALRPRGLTPAVAVTASAAAFAWLVLSALPGPLEGPGGATAVQARPVQAGATGHLPNLVSAGYPRLLLAQGTAAERAVLGARVQGMVGFGESSIEVQSLVSRQTRVDLAFSSASGFDDVAAALSVRAGGSAALALRDQPAITHSNYSLVMAAEGPTALLGRTTWEGGAEAVYEAPIPSRNVVLPLTARDVYSHTSVLWLQNTDRTGRNEVLVEAFQANGSLQNAWTVTLDPNESGPLDLYYEMDFAALPVNAATGYLGSFRLSAEAPIAVMAFGDEPQGRGAAAVAARPATAAAEVQYLPYVRATTTEGDSLIAIANVATRAVDVTITYSGGSDSPGGAGQSFEQSFSIAGRSQAFLDLDRRLGRGNRPVPNLPAWGFVGSATVRATGPVLATVLDHKVSRAIDPLYGGRIVDASHAYNGLGPSELSSTWVVPRARYIDANYATRLALQNPGDAPVAVSVSLRDDRGAPIGAPGQVTLPGNGCLSFAPTLPGPGTAQVLLSASAPIAALALDTSALGDWTAYSPVAMPATLIDVPTPLPPPTSTATPIPPTATATPRPGRTPTSGWVVASTSYLPFSSRR